MIDVQDGHITQRLSFAVAASTPLERLRAHATSRGWRYARLLSSAGSTYNRDYQAEDERGNQWPLATVFVRRDGRIHHFWSSELARRSRCRPGPASRRLPLAAVGRPRPDARGQRHRLGTGARLQLISGAPQGTIHDSAPLDWSSTRTAISNTSSTLQPITRRKMSPSRPASPTASAPIARFWGETIRG